MANYNAVKQTEDDAHDFHCLPPPGDDDDEPEDLFLDHDQNHVDSDHEHDHQHGPNNDTGLAGLVKRVRDRSTSKSSYDMLENDDFTAPMSPAEPASPNAQSPSSQYDSRKPEAIQTQAPDESLSLGELAKAMKSSESDDATSADPKSPVERTVSPEPMMRSASGRNIKLRHPSPGLQSLQGAYVGNIVNLEKSAERLSMTSDIAESIRRMSMELKRSDSRRSSILAATVEAIDIPTRQFSNNSIVEMNSAARNGGYSPGGFMMSPRSSMSGPIATRSASKSSKYSRPEPEQEGRPLDSIVTVPAADGSRKNSLVEDESTTFTRDVMAAGGMDEQRPTTSQSTNTYDHAQSMFMDFDGVHCAPSSRGPSANLPEKRMSVGNRLSAQPLTYADPASGQQMVYYPAPVPTMLNLPQKLSKNVGALARDKRRTQAMSTLPPQARQSAIWLPDVLETEDDAHDKSLENMEYMPQHQRRNMGGRRTMTDLENMPSQLRASTYFEHPSLSQAVELKGDSVTATLDSILDASAHAPVSAFTDHVFGGQLGKEVYGREPLNKRKSASNLLAPPETEAPKKEKRRSSFLGLGRRASSTDLLGTKENRKSTLSFSASNKLRKPRLSAEDEEIEDEDEAQEDGLLNVEDGIHPHADEEGQLEEVYTGPPTTLLAELQLRKQQQKLRTRPLTDVYANGVHSTLLEMEAVAQVQQKARQKKHVNLAWEEGVADDDENEDVPLGLLYGANSGANAAPVMRRGNRPIGLLERKDLEDNEPLSRRRERLTGRQSMRASTMLALPNLLDDEEEGETLAQRVKRLKAAGGTATGLPTSRPVSGDFASELMSQLGVEAANPDSKRTSTSAGDKGKGKESPVADEEEETLGQRRKRLQAEKEAREQEVGSGMLGAVLGAGGTPTEKEERPAVVKRNSLADVLRDNPVGPHRASSYGNAPLLGQEKGKAVGLLGAQERKEMRRASTMAELQKENHRISRAVSGDGGEALRNKEVKVGGLLGMRDEMRHSSLGLGIGASSPHMGMGVNPQARHSTMSFGTQQAFGTQPYGNQAANRSTMSFAPAVGMGYGMPPPLGFQQNYGMAYGQPANMFAQPMATGYGQPVYGQQVYGGQMYGYPQQNMMPMGMGMGGVQMQTGGVVEEQKGKDMVERWRQSIMP